MDPALLPAPTALLPAPTALASSSDYFRAVVARGHNSVKRWQLPKLQTSLGHPTRSPHFTRPFYSPRTFAPHVGAAPPGVSVTAPTATKELHEPRMTDGFKKSLTALSPGLACRSLTAVTAGRRQSAFGMHQPRQVNNTKVRVDHGRIGATMHQCQAEGFMSARQASCPTGRGKSAAAASYSLPTTRGRS